MCVSVFSWNNGCLYNNRERNNKNRQRIWSWAAVLGESDGSPVRHQTSTAANRLCVGLPTGSVPSQTLHPFQQQLQQFSSRFHPKTIFYRELIERRRKVVPATVLWHFLAQFTPVLFSLICLMCVHSTVMKYLSLTSNHNYVPLNSYYTGYHFA